MTSSMPIPPAIKFIVSFLTTPLQHTYSAETISIITHSLQKEFMSTIGNPHDDPSDNKWSIYLPLHPSKIPPKAILSACIASGIKWPRWILHLGGNEINFGVSNLAVVTHFPRNNVWMSLWQHPSSSSSTKRSEETAYAINMRKKYQWWQPPTASYKVDPDCIPVSPPRTCLRSSTITSAWRPDSPSRDSVWDDEDDDFLEDWEIEEKRRREIELRDSEGDDWEWDYHPVGVIA